MRLCDNAKVGTRGRCRIMMVQRKWEDCNKIAIACGDNVFGNVGFNS